jgi:hypothetical protein
VLGAAGTQTSPTVHVSGPLPPAPLLLLLLPAVPDPEPLELALAPLLPTLPPPTLLDTTELPPLPSFTDGGSYVHAYIPTAALVINIHEMAFWFVFVQYMSCSSLNRKSAHLIRNMLLLLTGRTEKGPQIEFA